MKNILFLLLLLAVCGTAAEAQLKIGKKTIDTKKALQAVSEASKAITITDQDIADMCREAVAHMDKENKVSATDSKYSARLTNLTKNLKVDGLELNFKVYETSDINAFACGDGSIRVFSALMDVMNDDELMAIIGHEIGHVVHTDTKDAMKNAYITSAAANAAGSVSENIAKLNDSKLGELSKSFFSARFSQKQENEADDYAFDFCVKNKFNPYGMANALNKLVELSGGAKASKLQQMFSSHPDSAKRALRMKEKADTYSKK